MSQKLCPPHAWVDEGDGVDRCFDCAQPWSAYAALPDPIKAIVDRNAALIAKRDRLKVEEVRELLAARVKTSTPSASHGTGH